MAVALWAKLRLAEFRDSPAQQHQVAERASGRSYCCEAVAAARGYIEAAADSGSVGGRQEAVEIVLAGYESHDETVELSLIHI